MDLTPIEEVLERLENVTKSGTGYAAFCPAHGDEKTRHLTITSADDGRVLLHCHHGCSFLEVMQALEMEPKQAFPRPIKDGNAYRFDSRDASGNLIAAHHRRKEKDGSKRVWWSTEAGTGLGGLSSSSMPLWGSEAVSAVEEEAFIVITEGEKAAFRLTNSGIPALGTVTGASGTPGDEALEVLKDRKVVLWPDHDDEGRGHMERIAALLVGKATEIRVYVWQDAKEKGDDAADHPAVRRQDAEALATLRAELESAPLYRPKRRRDEASSVGYLREEIVAWLKGEEEQGIATGITQLDRKILGLSPGRSYVIAGAPGDGKSLFCGQLGLTAVYQKKRVLLHSIESSTKEYTQRLICYMASVDYFRAIENSINEEEYNKLVQAFDYLDKLPFIATDLGTQTPTYIRKMVEKHQPDLLIVDYLQYATADTPSGNRVQDLDDISRAVTAIKSDYQIPVVMAEQINRDARSVNKEPELHSLRGSGGLEQDADVVMFLHRKTEKNGELSPYTKLLCKKNRIAKRFTMELEFVEGQQWFQEAFDPFTNAVVSYGGS